MANERLKKALKTTAKIAVSIVALWLVFSRIDFNETISLVRNAEYSYLLVGLFLYVISQLFSSERVWGVLRNVPVEISQLVNLRLYWLGMFYNFFLPGGVGGDGYKVYWIHKRHQTSYKKLVAALLTDRISGLVAICVYTVAYMALRSGILTGFGIDESLQHWLLLCIPVGIGLYALAVWFIDKNLVLAGQMALLKSIVIQGLQMATALSILLALGEDMAQMPDYLFLFLLSSIASAVPIAFGGAGSRELTFLYGSEYLGVHTATAVTLSLLFYLTSLVSSLPGIVFAVRTDLIDGKHVSPPEVTPDLADAFEKANEQQ
jgi:hypothetical protein